MTIQKQNELYKLLDDFFISKKCNYDCYNCDYGVLRGYGDSYQCAIEIVRDTMIMEDSNGQ